jgi:hypothetical protein
MELYYIWIAFQAIEDLTKALEFEPNSPDFDSTSLISFDGNRITMSLYAHFMCFLVVKLKC